MTGVLTSSNSVDIDDDVAVFSGSALATKQNEVTRRLFTAIRNSDVNDVAQILQSPDGSDVDHESCDQQGHTCIRIAIESRNLEIIGLLLQVWNFAYNLPKILFIFYLIFIFSFIFKLLVYVHQRSWIKVLVIVGIGLNRNIRQSVTLSIPACCLSAEPVAYDISLRLLYVAKFIL